MTWQVSSFALLAVVLAAGFLWYERRRPPARVVGVVAVLAALAVVGRLAFAAIPNVKPTTDIVLFAGRILHHAAGRALPGNIFLRRNGISGRRRPARRFGRGLFRMRAPTLRDHRENIRRKTRDHVRRTLQSEPVQ